MELKQRFMCLERINHKEALLWSVAYYFRHQWIFIYLCSILLSVFIVFLFFNSIVLAGLSTVFTIFIIKPLKKYNKSQLYKRFEQEFMNFIYSLSSLLSVGKSFESAFHLSVEELRKEGTVFLMREDLEKVSLGFEMNISISDALHHLSKEYPIESILNFTKIIEIAIIQGGKLETIIEDTVMMIREKKDVEKELEVIITQKRFELIILLSFVPGMILYLRVISTDFATSMYQTMTGRTVMVICLGIYLFSGYIGKKIVAIHI